MPTFDIIRKTEKNNSFRVASIVGRFELNDNTVTEHFKGDISIDNDWQVGLIVGASGTGKTTIAKELFPDAYVSDLKYCNKSILDDMPVNKSTTDITKMFNSVGFSSPPSWLKSYDVLSNGEKMRVDLARSLMEDKELIVFDEFTSVVDRQVAKIGSFAVQKAIRKTDKKFIAVGCHYDVEEWLMPDWVFDANTMEMKYNTRRLERRPVIEARIIETTQKDVYWKMFSRYHYLNHSLNKSCKLFLLEINNVICGMQAVLHFPHPKVKNMKKGHRLIIHPDYQGLGLGGFLSSAVGELMIENGFRFTSTTTNPALLYSRSKDDKWKLRRQGRVSKNGKTKLKNISSSQNRITTSWEYCGHK